MARGFLNHIWYKLLDEDGVPISGASVRIKDSLLNTLTILTSAGVSVSQPIITDSNGSFDFYVSDHIRANSQGGYGYTWDTVYVIDWSKDDKSGRITGDRLFGNFKSCNVSGSSTVLNKAMSNYIGWTLENHINSNFS